MTQRLSNLSSHRSHDSHLFGFQSFYLLYTFPGVESRSTGYEKCKINVKRVNTPAFGRFDYTNLRNDLDTIAH